MKAKGLNPADIMVLQMCRQNTPNDSHEILLREHTDDDENVLKSYEADDYIKFIKGTKKDSLFKRARISKKGELLLQQLQTYKVEEEDIIVYDWLKEYYLKIGKEVGSEKKGVELCAWFRRASGISRNNLVKLCKAFVNDEERMHYSLVLQFIFWKPVDHFQTKPKLEDSKLWLYYEKHRAVFEEIFE